MDEFVSNFIRTKFAQENFNFFLLCKLLIEFNNRAFGLNRIKKKVFNGE